MSTKSDIRKEHIDSIITNNWVKLEFSSDYNFTIITCKVKLDIKLNRKFVTIKDSISPKIGTFYNVIKPKTKLYLEDFRINHVKDLGSTKTRLKEKLTVKYI